MTQNKNQFDSTAYKKGYVDGYKKAASKVVKCNECKWYSKRMQECYHRSGIRQALPNDFCSKGERKNV